jgi:hypothetical protein
MKRDKKTKLQLTRTAIRQLNGNELAQLNGGAGSGHQFTGCTKSNLANSYSSEDSRYCSYYE